MLYLLCNSYMDDTLINRQFLLLVSLSLVKIKPEMGPAGTKEESKHLL
jgi:hypothetical protein